MTRETPAPDNPYYLQLFSRPWGYSYIDGEGKEQKIEDAVPGEPLFKFRDRVTIDPTWIDNVKEVTETTIGRLLFNHFCIMESFGVKFPYVNYAASVTALEKVIAGRYESTPKSESERSTEKYYVDEHTKFNDALKDFESLSPLASWSATPKAVLPPTGIREFKKELLKKYEGKLDDPVYVAAFEKELLAFDDEFLKGDPGNGTFIKGKIKNIARKKMYLTMGGELGFRDNAKSNTVIPSLNEGWPKDPVQFTRMMNGIRYGSFARGAETVKGGVAAKYLLRAANNFKIIDTNCGTPMGISRLYTEKTAEKLVGRYVLTTKGPVQIKNTEEAKLMIGKNIRVRSPMYCHLQGDNLCKICAGARLAQYPTGLTIPLTEISAVLLTASLKLSHVSGTKTARMNLQTSIT